MSYFWFQRTGGEEAWHEALSTHRSKVLAEIKPAFTTILDASLSPEPGWGREQYDEVKYSGPFYIDWDAQSIEEAIKGFHLFCAKMQEHEVDLHSVSIYATGGRGFHMEIPQGVFMGKVPKAGVSHLPGIYREMAMELLVDHMDMRVYTARKGRMWRTPGVQRSNGKYKVPLTVEQALSVTPETYDELCSEPRLEPERTTPELNMALSTLYVKCQERVAKGVKGRAKSAKDKELLTKFKGDFPPSIKRFMAGEGLAEGIGFNRIALQLAITAHAVGKSAEDLVKSCEGLIKNHQSDGRYSSPRRRREALIELWHYTNESDAYSYSRGGVKSLAAPGFPTGDLDGLDSSAIAGRVPESFDTAEESIPDDVSDELSGASDTLLEGMTITRDGVYKRTSEGYKMLSNIAFTSPAIMVDSEDTLTLGVEAELYSDGRNIGRHLLPSRVFQSRSALSAFCSGRNGIFSGTDTQAGVLQLMMQRKAREGKRVIYVVHREGLDLIQNPEDRSKPDLDVVWAAPERVLSYRDDIQYRFQPKLSTNDQFKTDIHLCEAIADTPDTREWLKALFTMNSPEVVAQMLGWFVSCFHKQFYIRAFSQFPLLHPNGPAGSGKTLTTTLMARMFHNTSQPSVRAAGILTDFSMRSMWASSASVPLILDEYKPAEFRPGRHDFLLQHFRLVYNQGLSAMGGISRGNADSSFRDVTEFAFSAPTVYLGESQEMQTAVVQRSIPLHFNPEDSRSHTSMFDKAYAGARLMPQLGRAVLALTMGVKHEGRMLSPAETVEGRAEALRPQIAALRSSFDRSVHDRQVFNLAVVLEGLNYLDRVLQGRFGDVFRGDMDRLRQSIHDHKADIQVSVMSEAAKALNDMSLISRTEEPDSEFSMREGFEYVIVDGHIDILMREAFVKYFAWAKRKGFTPLYTGPESFITAMGKFPAVQDKLCLGSPLRKSAQSRIFRFSLVKLAAEGVEGFRSKLTD